MYSIHTRIKINETRSEAISIDILAGNSASSANQSMQVVLRKFLIGTQEWGSRFEGVAPVECGATAPYWHRRMPSNLPDSRQQQQLSGHWSWPLRDSTDLKALSLRTDDIYDPRHPIFWAILRFINPSRMYEMLVSGAAIQVLVPTTWDTVAVTAMQVIVRLATFYNAAFSLDENRSRGRMLHSDWSV